MANASHSCRVGEACVHKETHPSKKKARHLAGPSILVLSDKRLVLETEEAADLPVQASPDHRKVVAIATVVKAEAGKLGIHHLRAGVAHAHHVAAPDEAVVLPVALEVDVQAFDLHAHVVEPEEAAGEGILNAATHCPTPVVVVAVVVEEAKAGVGRTSEAACESCTRRRIEPRANERRAVRDTRAECAEAVEVVTTVAVREGGTTGGVDQQAIKGVAEAAPHRTEPVDAVAVEAVEAVSVEAVEQCHVAERTVADPGRGQDARPRAIRKNGRSREDAGSTTEAEAAEVVIAATTEVGVLSISLDTDDEAAAWRELEVVADLATAHEAFPLATVVEAAKAEVVEPGQRHHRREASIGLHGQAAAEVVEAEGIVVAVAGVKTVTRVHAEVEARPREHRNSGVRDRGRSDNRAARQVGRHRGGREPKQGD